MAGDAIQAYLADLPDKLKGICTKLHALALSQMPGAHAMVYHGVLGYSPSPSPFDRVVYIAPQRDWVNLGFFFGADIPDPRQLLIGEGARMRHIKIRTEREADNPALKRILKGAWKKAPQDVARLHARRTKKKS